MKTNALISASVFAILTTVDLFAQGAPYGIINFSNLGRTAEDRVYLGYLGGPLTPVPAGSAYMVALYWGPAGAATDANFIQAGFAVTFAASGQFGGGNRTITPMAVNGDTVSVQVRGFSTAQGARTYEQAFALQNEVGSSAWFDMKTKDPTDFLSPPTLGIQPGWGGFSIAWDNGGGPLVPEPSIIGLGLLGVAALLLRARHRFHK